VQRSRYLGETSSVGMADAVEGLAAIAGCVEVIRVLMCVKGLKRRSSLTRERHINGSLLLYIE